MLENGCSTASSSGLAPSHGISSSKLARTVFFICSFFYALALHYAHKIYLYPTQEFWGFPYSPLGPAEWIYLVAAVLVAALVLPLNFTSPSGLIIFVLFLIVYLPSVTITLATKPMALSVYGDELSALVFGFACVALSTRVFAPSRRWLSNTFKVSLVAHRFLFLGCLILFIFILYSFQDVISFVGLDDIYVQREAGRSQNAAQAYAQTYLAYVFAPAVFALGIICSKMHYRILGLASFALMFGVTAERTLVLLPLVMAVLYPMILSKGFTQWKVCWITLALAFFVLVATFFAGSSLIFDLVSLYFVMRLLAIPGSFFWQYSDTFSGYGYTYWDHVKGFDLLADAPSVLLSHPYWPQLGYIVADNILGLESNSNANLFAADGIAAAGSVGILVVCVVLSFWLIALDRASKGFEHGFVLLVAFPLAFNLTNGSVFSMLFSFGGLFWIAFFFFNRFLRNQNFGVSSS